MFGTHEDASTALSIARQFFANPEVPEGWDFVGAGAFRTVWYHDGVCYKVAHDVDEDGDPCNPHANEREFYNYGWMSPILPPGVRFPRMHDWYVWDETTEQSVMVIAAEYVEGKEVWCDDLTPVERRFIKDMGLYDVEGDNVCREANGTLVLLDFTH
jgi:hypothetical protein